MRSPRPSRPTRQDDPAEVVIPTVGALIRFLDTEGNDIGAMKYETAPHT